ncbi:MAG: AhpC/TSA family protein [Bacteroidales bacterium]|nr:AhpC/TSA family protein [Bacteroidales bacterium]
MKKINILLCSAILSLVFFASCGSKSSYTITGTVPSSVTSEYIYLYSGESMEPVLIDSAKIKNNTFKFKGKVDSISLVMLHPGSENENPMVIWDIILEPGKIIIDSASRFVTGTPMNNDFKIWVDSINSYSQEMDAPLRVSQYFSNHWKEHSSDFFGALMLTVFNSILPFPQIDTLSNSIPEEIRSRQIFKPLFQSIDIMRKSKVGSPFIDTPMVGMDGKPAKLSDYIGKGEYVLVDFWASWCKPCRQGMPMLQEVAKKNPNLKVLGIAVSDKEDEALAAIKEMKITWPVLFDQPAASAQAYGLSAIPAMILFSPDGTILQRDFRVEDLASILENYMK